MRTFQPRVCTAMMSGDVSFCRLAALVHQHLCDQLDERAGLELRRDLRIVHVPSGIRRRRFGRPKRPVELRVAIAVGASMRACTSCDNRTIPGEQSRDVSAARGDTSARSRRVSTALCRSARAGFLASCHTRAHILIKSCRRPKRTLCLCTSSPSPRSPCTDTHACRRRCQRRDLTH